VTRFAAVHESAIGTFETCQPGLTMSVAEGKAEAAVPLVQGIVRTKKPAGVSFGSGRLTSVSAPNPLPWLRMEVVVMSCVQ